jgi:hypothetical protein
MRRPQLKQLTPSLLFASSGAAAWERIAAREAKRAPHMVQALIALPRDILCSLAGEGCAAPAYVGAPSWAAVWLTLGNDPREVKYARKRRLQSLGESIGHETT